MFATSQYVAQEIAQQYTRDRIREAEAARMVQEARTAAREQRMHGAPEVPRVVPGASRWRWARIRRASVA